MTDLLTENARLRAALIQSCLLMGGQEPMTKRSLEAALTENLECIKILDALATPAPDTRKEVMPDDETTLSHARPDTSPGVTAGAPAPDAVQEAARDGDDTPIKVLETIVRQIDQGGEDGKVFARDNCIARARKFISEAQGKAK